MIIYNTHQKIDALIKIVPEGFVFVLDTTDRSFIYTSHKSLECEQLIFSIDKMHGIDNLTKYDDHYSYEADDIILKLQKSAKNTFLGVCISISDTSKNQLLALENCFEQVVTKSPASIPSV